MCSWQSGAGATCFQAENPLFLALKEASILQNRANYKSFQVLRLFLHGYLKFEKYPVNTGNYADFGQDLMSIRMI